MSDNTKQYQWIVAVQGAIDNLFRDDPDVFVAGDLLWYPVEGQPKIRASPDTMAVFGRPKGDRGSYIQHREEGIAPQVVFEVLSPGNRPAEMRRKLAFYDQYGPEEYYVLDPDHARHKGYLRTANGTLELLPDLFGWISPRLRICFEMTPQMKDVLRIIGPDGRPFEMLQTIFQQRAAQERRADEATLQAEAERNRAAESDLAVAQEKARAEEAIAKAERLLAQLRALGMEPEA